MGGHHIGWEGTGWTERTLDGTGRHCMSWEDSEWLWNDLEQGLAVRTWAEAMAGSRWQLSLLPVSQASTWLKIANTLMSVVSLHAKVPLPALSWPSHFPHHSPIRKACGLDSLFPLFLPPSPLGSRHITLPGNPRAQVQPIIPQAERLVPHEAFLPLGLLSSKMFRVLQPRVHDPGLLA